MMPTIAPLSVLSAPQRRCHILLTLFQPGLVTTTETLSKLNGVDVEIVSKDLNETSREIAGYHQLTIKTAQNGGFRIEGTELNQRLCLLHWLRRGLRLCPAFINEQFTPALKNALKQCGIERTLYDDTNLRALINLCARRLNMQFGDRDMQFLQLFWQYCLLNHHAGQTPDFTPLQQQWMQSCAAWPFALELSRFLHRRAMRNVPREESLFIALLFTLLRVPDPRRDN
ncbi:stationary phase inducible protein CsiE, partial [Escherichia fergusonii]|nr:stationary phase inducible protein CsiE [Escherichia fergusonii]